MLAIDTNVLVRLIARDEPAQTQAAESAIAKGAWVSHLALAETAWVLSTRYGMTHQRLADTLEDLLGERDIVFQDVDVILAALTFFRRRKSVSFSDCLLVEIARKAGHTPLVTFDRDLAKLDGVQRLDRVND